MGRHALAEQQYRPITGKHKAVSSAVDTPEGVAVVSSAGVRRIPITAALAALLSSTAMVPAAVSDDGRAAEVAPADDPVRADPSVVLAPARVEVRSESAPPPPPAPPAEVAPAVVSIEPVNEVVVGDGDTVGSLAARYGVDVGGMLAANGLGPYTPIFVGQTLLLTGPAKPVPAPPPPPPARAPAIVPASVPAPAPAPAPVVTGRAQAIVNAALAQVGEAQDCVKMVADALATVGIYHYVWPVQYYQIGYAVSDPLPGDLIYYVNGGGGLAHIAIYIGDGQAVHGGWDGSQTRVFSVNVGSGPNYIRLR